MTKIGIILDPVEEGRELGTLTYFHPNRFVLSTYSARGSSINLLGILDTLRETQVTKMEIEWLLELASHSDFNMEIEVENPVAFLFTLLERNLLTKFTKVFLNSKGDLKLTPEERKELDARIRVGLL